LITTGARRHEIGEQGHPARQGIGAAGRASNRFTGRRRRAADHESPDPVTHGRRRQREVSADSAIPLTAGRRRESSPDDLNPVEPPHERAVRGDDVSALAAVAPATARADPFQPEPVADPPGAGKAPQTHLPAAVRAPQATGRHCLRDLWSSRIRDDQCGLPVPAEPLSSSWRLWPERFTGLEISLTG
jgi:hypothetical protein